MMHRVHINTSHRDTECCLFGPCSETLSSVCLKSKKAAGGDFIHSTHSFSSVFSQTKTFTAQCPHSAKPQVCWMHQSHQSHSRLYWWTDDTSEQPVYTVNMQLLKEINDHPDRLKKELEMFYLSRALTVSISFSNALNLWYKICRSKQPHMFF